MRNLSTPYFASSNNLGDTPTITSTIHQYSCAQGVLRGSILLDGSYWTMGEERCIAAGRLCAGNMTRAYSSTGFRPPYNETARHVVYVYFTKENNCG